jgi:hypothetical protein
MYIEGGLMGFYIETGTAKGKASIVARELGGTLLTRGEAAEIVKDPKRAIIVVLDNGPFEAAGFAFNEEEFDALTSDDRPKEYVEITRAQACELTGYSDG